MIDISKIRVGDKVHYQPKHYSENEWENGMVKEVPDFATDKTAQVGYNSIRVVYDCDHNWDNFECFTSALTDLRDLNLGWKH